MVAFSNFAVTRVRVAPAPMAAGTTMTVDDPTVFTAAPPFNLTVWPHFADEPTLDNSEVVTVTAIAGKVLTVVRAQEGSRPMKIWVEYKVAQLPTKAFYENLQAAAVAEAVPEAVVQSTTITETIVTETFETIYDSIPPEPLGAETSGTETKVARRDHVHQMPKLDDLNSPDDTTDLDATQSLHGLMSKVDKVRLDLGKRTLKSVTNTYTVDTTTQDQVIFCSRPTPFTVTLVDATAGAGLTHYERELTIANLGAGEVTVASAAGNQVFTTAASASVLLLTGDSVTLFCNGVVWKVI